MGTSNAFKGSGGKDASDLRDAIADWLGDDVSPAQDGEADSSEQHGAHAAGDSAPSLNLIPLLRLWRDSSSGVGGGAGSGGSGGSTGGRSSGGVRRTVTRVSGPAGRAGSLARAYAAGDRAALESAGLDYDALRALDDPIEVGRRIASVAFEAQADSSLEDSEARLIVAELIAWVLAAPNDQVPTPNDIVRHSIELMMLKSALVEVGDTIRSEPNATKRRAAEAEVGRAAHVLASQVPLNETGTSAAEISEAIEGGVRQLTAIFGAGE
ncbi:hypothetical protein [Timonella sp. A28]|uniref:hypothetical protein n=1 Tax=Timonella sp. A28 TaxID=3442640 RepID=UPI003EBA5F2F